MFIYNLDSFFLLADLHFFLSLIFVFLFFVKFKEVKSLIILTLIGNFSLRLSYIPLFKTFFDVFYYFEGSFFINTLVLFIGCFSLLLLILLLLVVKKNFLLELHAEYIFMFSFSLGALLLVLSTQDFFFIYLCFEIMSLSFYLVAAFKKYSVYSVEAAMRYFLLSAFISGIFIFGLSLFYFAMGSLDMYKISLLLFNNNNDILLILVYFIVSVVFLFKLGVFPFHIWVPDVYQGASTFIVAFFAIIPKVILLYVYAYLCYNIFFFHFMTGSMLLLLCGVLSVCYGTIVGLYQVELKRLLAYSAISNFGFIIAGISLVTLPSIVTSFNYAIIYTFNLASFFFILLSVERYLNYKHNEIKGIIDFIVFFITNPFLSFICGLTFLSFAGIPPFSAFFAKFLLMLSFVETGHNYCVLILMAVNVISAVYYARLFRFIFFGPYVLDNFHYREGKSILIMLFLFFFNITFFFFQPILLLFIYQALLPVFL